MVHPKTPEPDSLQYYINSASPCPYRVVLIYASCTLISQSPTCISHSWELYTSTLPCPYIRVLLYASCTLCVRLSHMWQQFFKFGCIIYVNVMNPESNLVRLVNSPEGLRWRCCRCQHGAWSRWSLSHTAGLHSMMQGGRRRLAGTIRTTVDW